MTAFLLAHWVEIVLSLITAGALAFCRGFWKRYKEYKALADKETERKTERLIETELEPIKEEIEELRRYIRETADTEQRNIALIISSYKFRLTQMCKLFLEQKYLTQDQYDQLTEFYKLYEALGGNGQAKQYYDKTIVLPIQK